MGGDAKTMEVGGSRETRVKGQGIQEVVGRSAGRLAEMQGG